MTYQDHFHRKMKEYWDRVKKEDREDYEKILEDLDKASEVHLSRRYEERSK